MLRILALVAVLLIALLGYSLGMDGGMITLLIVILGTLMFVLGHLQQKYGTKKLLGGMVERPPQCIRPYTAPPVI